MPRSIATGIAGSGWQLPPGGGRTAVSAYAGLEVGMLPPPGPSPAVRALLAAGALPVKVAGGCRGAEPPARGAPFAPRPLGKNAGCVSGPGDGSARDGRAGPPRSSRPRNPKKAFRWDRLRRSLHHLSQRVAPPGSSWAKCGRVPRGHKGPQNEVAPLSIVGVVGEYATFGGLCTCGCPRCVLCGPKIARERAAYLQTLMNRIYEAGGEVYLCTCTIPHDATDSLKLMRTAIGDAWRYVQQGRAWKELRARLRLDFIRGDDEPTWGARGWHPHLHVLVVAERRLTQAEVQELWEHIYTRWSTRIELYGFRRPSREHGVDLRASSQADYIVKLGLADELASGLYKEPRDGRLSPLQLLMRHQETQNRCDLALYREYRVAYHGARKLTYSRGLRERYAMPDERTDEEIAANEEMPSGGQPFEFIFDDHDRVVFNRAVVDSPERQAEILACGRRAGVDGVETYLRYITVLLRLADRLGLSPFASTKQIEARAHDPPRMTG